MYQAIPYSAGQLSACLQQSEQAEAEGAAGQEGGLAARRHGGEGLVLVVGRCGCYLSHVVKRLLQGLGVNPAVHEAVVALLAAFVGGRNLGGLDRLMAVHISGELVPILKDAGTL
ncbi:hypothetical protein VPH35_020708 [Triticum aestivum]